jgi:hypothetical protein
VFEPEATFGLAALEAEDLLGGVKVEAEGGQKRRREF